MSNQTTLSLFSFLSKNVEIDQLTQSDWLNFCGVVIGAPLTAGLVTFLIQRYFIKLEERKNLINEIHKFNESIIYLSSFLETIVSKVDGLILKNYDREMQYIENLRKALGGEINLEQNRQIVHESIAPLKFETNEFRKNIPDILSANSDIFMNISRLEELMSDFSNIVIDRNNIAKSFSGITKTDFTGIKDRLNLELYNEEMLFDRTKKLLIISEGILDIMIFLSRKMSNIAKDKKRLLKKNNVNNIDVFYAEENALHIMLLKQIKIIVDGFPNYRNRQQNIKY